MPESSATRAFSLTKGNESLEWPPAWQTDTVCVAATVAPAAGVAATVVVIATSENLKVVADARPDVLALIAYARTRDRSFDLASSIKYSSKFYFVAIVAVVSAVAVVVTATAVIAIVIEPIDGVLETLSELIHLILPTGAVISAAVKVVIELTLKVAGLRLKAANRRAGVAVVSILAVAIAAIAAVRIVLPILSRSHGRQAQNHKGKCRDRY